MSDTVVLFMILLAILAGAALGGGATFFWGIRRIERRYHPNERRLNILDEIAGLMGQVNATFARYAALISELLPNSQSIAIKQQQELEAVTEELVGSFRLLAEAESKLSMLGEKRLEKALKLYSTRMANFRKQFFYGRGPVNSAEITLARKEVASLREQFYSVLSDRYDTHLR